MEIFFTNSIERLRQDIKDVLAHKDVEITFRNSSERALEVIKDVLGKNDAVLVIIEHDAAFLDTLTDEERGLFTRIEIYD